MNEGLKLLMTRRSIRKYTDEPVGQKEVEQVLRAAMAAPSAGNERPWHFVVIRERDVMDQIMDVHPYAAALQQASVCIAVLAEVSLEKFAGYWVQDTSAATLNILLAAHALGLGAVWLGVHPVQSRKEGIKRILSLPDGVECLALVAIGHPAEDPGPADRYDPARVHEQSW
ncbi:MAG: nitroreductase family protein [Planctomycetota bacterium]|jgi:nitroreductase